MRTMPRILRDGYSYLLSNRTAGRWCCIRGGGYGWLFKVPVRYMRRYTYQLRIIRNKQNHLYLIILIFVGYCAALNSDMPVYLP